MPFLRVIRDKRGYETTYLMHWYQEGSRQRSRILYAFRTPAGARVGRDGLDPAVMRQIEGLNPGISFDWKTVLAERQVIESAPELRRRKPRRADAAPAAAETPRAAPASSAAGAAAQPAPPRPPVPAEIVGETTEERVAFLKHWYPLVLERVERRASDPDRQAALLSLAERMNPDAWGGEAEPLDTRLQQAGEALERLSHVFARRRRTRRRPASEPGTPPVPPTPPPES